MPKIRENEANENYLRKYVVSVIMPNGDLIAVKKDNSEFFHGDAFTRLLTEIKNIYGISYEVESQVDCEYFLNLLSSKGLIVLSTYKVNQPDYDISKDIQLVKFPSSRDTNLSQYMSLKKIIDNKVFEGIKEIEFSQYKSEPVYCGLEVLKKFLDESIRDSR